MRRLAVLLLALASCKEAAVLRPPPTDRFLSPMALALTERAPDCAAPPCTGVYKSLLVVSSNFNLEFDGATGGTVLSVNPDPPAPSPPVLSDPPSGSAVPGGGALVKLPADGGARIASFAGQVAAVDAGTCTGYTGAAMALVPSRYDDALNVLPLGTGGALGSLPPCVGSACQVPFRPLLHDPWSVTLACRAERRADLTQRSVFVGFQSPSSLDGYPAGIGWLEEFDVDELAAGQTATGQQPTGRTLEVGATPIAEAVYDAGTDRIVAVGRPNLLTAPLVVIDLPSCRIDGSPIAGQEPGGSCPQPVIHTTDLNLQLPGTDLQAVALSSPGAGPRRAYLAARLYDASIAALIGARPSGDIAAALLVVDMEDNRLGRPAGTILRVVPLGMGASQVRVLPARPNKADGTPRRDLVVATSSAEGVVTIYDDEEEVVVRAIGLETTTGGAQAGRLPFALAVEPSTRTTAAGTVARVYVAAFGQSVVSILDVPPLAPGQAHLLRDGADTLLRIGGLQ